MSKVIGNALRKLLMLCIVSFASSNGVTFGQDAAEATDASVPKVIAEEETVIEVAQLPFEEESVSIQLRTNVAVENARVRRVCKLSADQLKQLEKFDPKWIKENAKLPQAPGNNARGVLRMVVGLGAQPVGQHSVLVQVSNAHRKELAAILTAEQLAEYDKAVEDRNVFRKRANAECVIALLDQRLCLSEEQRTEIQKQLMDWPPIENLQPVFYFQNQGYWPSLPNELVKVLNKSQRAVFEGVQKADFQGEMFDAGGEHVLIDR